MKPAKVATFFSRPDQEHVRADLTDFFGPRASAYLKTYGKMQERGGKRPRWHWSWPVFFFSFVWYFYRKMYLVGAVWLLTPVVAGLLFGKLATAGVGYGMASTAKWIYVRTGLSRIAKADELGLLGEERSEYLHRAGGVSMVAGALAGFIYVGFSALLVVAVIAKHYH